MNGSNGCKQLNGLKTILVTALALTSLCRAAMAERECPHMVAAYNALTTANTYLQNARHVFAGERIEAINDIAVAQSEIFAGLVLRSCDGRGILPPVPVAKVAGSNCPWLEGSIPYLEVAIGELNAARRFYAGLRYQADNFANAALDEVIEGAWLRGCYY